MYYCKINYIYSSQTLKVDVSPDGRVSFWPWIIGTSAIKAGVIGGWICLGLYGVVSLSITYKTTVLHPLDLASVAYMSVSDNSEDSNSLGQGSRITNYWTTDSMYEVQDCPEAALSPGRAACRTDKPAHFSPLKLASGAHFHHVPELIAKSCLQAVEQVQTDQKVAPGFHQCPRSVSVENLSGAGGGHVRCWADSAISRSIFTLLGAARPLPGRYHASSLELLSKQRLMEGLVEATHFCSRRGNLGWDICSSMRPTGDQVREINGCQGLCGDADIWFKSSRSKESGRRCGAALTPVELSGDPLLPPWITWMPGCFQSTSMVSSSAPRANMAPRKIYHIPILTPSAESPPWAGCVSEASLTRPSKWAMVVDFGKKYSLGARPIAHWTQSISAGARPIAHCAQSINEWVVIGLRKLIGRESALILFNAVMEITINSVARCLEGLSSEAGTFCFPHLWFGVGLFVVGFGTQQRPPLVAVTCKRKGRSEEPVVTTEDERLQIQPCLVAGRPWDLIEATERVSLTRCACGSSNVGVKKDYMKMS
ncbi:hypothetical protein Bbelb_411640 [Branchiostoma belcheri]|nr:hypothetical protein Bbelb_411640 [Branchiostoma belcheri]